MPKDFLVATFSDAERLIQAVRVMRGEKFRIYDVYAPYPVHNLEEAMGIRRSRLPWVTLMLGASGLLLALLLQFSLEAWPLWRLYSFVRAFTRGNEKV